MYYWWAGSSGCCTIIDNTHNACYVYYLWYNMEEEVKRSLERDQRASDFLLGVFWAALSSYRHDTVLRPYPSEFVLSDGSKDVDRLKSVFSGIPSVKELITSSDRSVPNQSLALAHWILSTISFTLHSRPADTMKQISLQVGGPTHTLTTPTPHSIIEIVYSDERERKFMESAGDYGTFLAYHGSRVDNFYSIIHNGLLNHMNKTAAFGEGTYLSTDISVCMNFSPTGTTWVRDCLPSLCSMVAVCEVVGHPDVRSRTQIGGEPSLNQRIPQRYFVVQNNSWLRVKYVLIFSHRQHMLARRTGWIYQHKWALCIILYLTILLLVGLYHSGYYNRLYYTIYPRHLLN